MKKIWPFLILFLFLYPSRIYAVYYLPTEDYYINDYADVLS